jgi:hypothetical protein
VGLFTSTVLALLVAVQPVPPAASAPKAPESPFTPFRVYENFTLSIDKNSFKILNSGQYPLIGLDVQLVFPRAIKFDDSQLLVKSYVNTLAVDCVTDQILVIVSRVFDEKGELKMVVSPAGVLENTNTPNTPTTELINLICPALLDRNKQTPVLFPVTKPSELTV